jgi:hypothetical protein
VSDPNLPHGLSLFETIPEDRDCKSASIPDMFCGCFEEHVISDYRPFYTTGIIGQIVDKINNFTASVRQMCAPFVFESISRVYVRENTHRDSEYILGNSTFYMLQLYVRPGGALFETVVKVEDMNMSITGDITRINRYGNQSYCMNDKILKNYCFCVNK